MPLAIIGTEAVWQNTLRKFNVPEAAISRFIPGPAYTAWWLMGNLEGWAVRFRRPGLINKPVCRRKSLAGCVIWV